MFRQAVVASGPPGLGHARRLPPGTRGRTLGAPDRTKDPQGRERFILALDFGRRPVLGFPLDLGFLLDVGFLGLPLDLGYRLDLGFLIDLGLLLDLGFPRDLGLLCWGFWLPPDGRQLLPGAFVGVALKLQELEQLSLFGIAACQALPAGFERASQAFQFRGASGQLPLQLLLLVFVGFPRGAYLGGRVRLLLRHPMLVRRALLAGTFALHLELFPDRVQRCLGSAQFGLTSR
ncbi:MAG: hypothetical protein J5I93_29300 [Pirellulaceae bacterium]|nr:hypothetical protein [Pirellulaceae bacterium]